MVQTGIVSRLSLLVCCRILNLNSNKFGGSLPPMLGTLSNLVYVCVRVTAIGTVWGGGRCGGGGVRVCPGLHVGQFVVGVAVVSFSVREDLPVSVKSVCVGCGIGQATESVLQFLHVWSTPDDNQSAQPRSDILLAEHWPHWLDSLCCFEFEQCHVRVG